MVQKYTKDLDGNALCGTQSYKHTSELAPKKGARNVAFDFLLATENWLRRKRWLRYQPVAVAGQSSNSSIDSILEIRVRIQA